jgi:hypothetical protein
MVHAADADRARLLIRSRQEKAAETPDEAE